MKDHFLSFFFAQKAHKEQNITLSLDCKCHRLHGVRKIHQEIVNVILSSVLSSFAEQRL